MNTTREAFLSLIASDEDYYKPSLDAAKKECQELISCFYDDKALIAGWGHNFVCSDCGAKLIFDAALKDPRGKTFSCSICKKEATGKKLEEAWVFYMRHFTSLHLRSAALCAVLGDKEAKAFIEKYLDFYAENYVHYKIHGEHGSNNGRLLGQILDESVWASHVSFALYTCRDLFPKEKTEYWYELLFKPLVKLTDVPSDGRVFIHNHMLWHKCAVGAIAIAFDKKELLLHALDDPSGVRQQLELGLTKDAFWFECSTGYHYYAMRALGEFCALFANEYPSDPINDIFAAAMLAPLKLSYNGRALPSLNDGWYPLAVDENAELFHYAYAAKPTDALGDVIAAIKGRVPTAFKSPLALFLDTPQKTECAAPLGAEKPRIELLSATRLAVLREPVFAVFKAGVIEEWHKHDDMLSLILPPFSDDIGTCNYGHPLYEGFYARAVCHNTVTVDQKQPKEVLKTSIREIKNGVCASVDGGWDGVLSAKRTLLSDDGVLKDVTEIECDEDRVIDWLFHTDGEVFVSPAPEKEIEMSQDFGYEYFTDTRALTADTITLKTKKNGECLTLRAKTAGMEVILAKSPNNPANKKRTTLILRKRGKSARFAVTYERN